MGMFERGVAWTLTWTRLRRLFGACGIALLIVCACGDDDSAAGEEKSQWIERPQTAKVAVVFVHGVLGSAVATWTHESGATFFSALKAHPQLGSSLALYAAGYPSRMVSPGSLQIQEAANKIHEDLKFDGVLDYETIAFVGHSMGGLVVLKELLTHRELFAKVPLLAFYATPMEGAQIATLGKALLKNAALAEMEPADLTANLNELDSQWREAGPERPTVRCAYETRPTYGVQIVRRSSATRFCDGASDPIDGDHLTLVKPAESDAPAVRFLSNALRDHVMVDERSFLLPDTERDNDAFVLKLSDPREPRILRVQNGGTSRIRFGLESVPEHGLLVVPSAGVTTLRANETSTLRLVVTYGSEQPEYTFVVQPHGLQPRRVRVVIPPSVLLAERTALRLAIVEHMDADLTALTKSNDTPTMEAANTASASAKAAVAEVVPGLPEAAQWLVAAAQLNEINLPAVADVALTRALNADASLETVAAVAQLRSEIEVFDDLPKRDASEVVVTALKPTQGREELNDPRYQAAALQLSTTMRSIPTLESAGHSIRGDVLLAKVRTNAAQTAYLEAINTSPVTWSSPEIRRQFLKARPPPDPDM